jgi:hypothetical protein
MRNVFFVCAAAFCLSGCAAFQSAVGGLNGATTSQLITDVETAAVSVCKFLPTAETVAGIIAVGSPALATASSIASAICAAVGPPHTTGTASVRVATIPRVAGVLVHGQFVR